MGGDGLDSSSSGQGQMAASCGHGTKLLIATKRGEFTD
jgi:hypothetical protein